MRKLVSTPIAAIFLVSGILAIAVSIASYVVGNGLLNGPVVAVTFIAIGALAIRTHPAVAPVGAAVALIGQAIAFTMSFQGHPWQIDSHMLFFALLACLVCLRIVLALLTATAIRAVDHLSFTFFMPALVYPSVDLAKNLNRTIFHAAIIVMETLALVVTVLHLKRAELKMAKANEDRESANIERQKDQKATARKQEAKAKEQNKVVELLDDALNSLRQGDLTVRIGTGMPETYEGLRISFNSTTETLQQMVAEVSHQTRKIEMEVNDIAASASDLAKRTERQAITLSEANCDITALADRATMAAQAVEKTTASASQAQSNADASKQIVAEASDVMNSVHVESKEISKIVELIDQIAFQTNLLALNAGVEAARAGEAGQGFAVVASEVRALASRSSESATSIRELIERSGDEVENCAAKILETVSSLGSVRASVSEITGSSEVVTQLTHEQRSAAQDLNTKISKLDGMTQNNAAMFEETSAACSALLNSTTALRRSTENFLVDPSASVEDVAA